MNVFVTGATGLLGSRVVEFLLSQKHAVTIITRDKNIAKKKFNQYQIVKILEGDITKEGTWQAEAEQSDSILHFAGAGIVDKRWSALYKKVLWDSRVESTKRVAEVSNKVLVCASATGFYGDRDDEKLTEESSPGLGFLSELCKSWEDAAMTANGRTVCLRFGMILDNRGGVLAKMRPIIKWGLGGPLATGRQYWPWISWEDAVAIVDASINTNWHGAVNAVAPQQLTCKEFIKTLSNHLKRPAFFKVPNFALRGIVGEGSQVLTASQRVIPDRLQGWNFQFKHPVLDSVF